MTITLASINDVPAAVRGGGVVECPGCEGRGYRYRIHEDGKGESRWECPTCNEYGTVRYHDLTRGRWVYPHGFTGVLSEETFIRGFENWIRGWCSATPESFKSDPYNDYNEANRKEHVFRCGIRAMVDAIGPNDVLIHDGTDLGARCAEVVKNLAQQRPRAGR